MFRRRSLQQVRRTRAPPPPVGATPPAGLARGGASSAPATRTILKECGKSHTFLAGNLSRFWRETHTFLAGNLTRLSFLAGNLTSLAEISESLAQNFVGKLDKIGTELLVIFWLEVDKLS